MHLVKIHKQQLVLEQRADLERKFALLEQNAVRFSNKLLFFFATKFFYYFSQNVYLVQVKCKQNLKNTKKIRMFFVILDRFYVLILLVI